ncbi:MAG: hypothetical protein AAB472_03765 [Patescibacteria group bacterium]
MTVILVVFLISSEPMSKEGLIVYAWMLFITLPLGILSFHLNRTINRIVARLGSKTVSKKANLVHDLNILLKNMRLSPADLRNMNLETIRAEAQDRIRSLDQQALHLQDRSGGASLDAQLTVQEAMLCVSKEREAYERLELLH